MISLVSLFTRTLLCASIISGAAHAGVTEKQAAQLGSSLTPLGAEKAGNQEGTIPAWDGGLPTNAGSVDAKGARSNPFAAEKPLFVIDASNVAQYEKNLSPGQVAMFKRFPETFKMPVYPTHRSAAVPDEIYKATVENATKVELINDGNGMKNYVKGTPFPIPQSGVEVVWNHISRYIGGTMKRTMVSAAPQANGQFTANAMHQIYSPAWMLSDFKPENNNALMYYTMRNISPARYAGNVMLVKETIDQVAEPRMAWQYNSGQRRVRRAPQIAYDSPASTGDGQHTTDNYAMFNGAPDRYDWKLVGKREMYIPYNSYALDDSSLTYENIVKPGHLNTAYTRYELHRVWEVVGTLKPGMRHIYAKRHMFVDEDSWQISILDHYDGRGQLWRMAEGHQEQIYDQKIPLLAVETCYDLMNGRYFVVGMHNEVTTPPDFNYKTSSAEFSPAALRNMGVR